ncbi:hypothetical protein XAP3CFBP6996_022485, partial [Xanthomonas citri pv. fuscans CFBP 6996]
MPGEGVGALVLKRLSDAEAAGDPIHGVILGSGINQDGKTNGITAPSAVRQAELQREVYARHGIDPATIGYVEMHGTGTKLRQAELQREVYARHGIDPSTIGYVEMHGTGTKLGDPIELEALRSVYEAAGVGRQRCVLGSVKSNIGHTSAAAGVAGVHKVLLGLRHGELVPSLHFATPNEHFDFATSPFRVGTAREAWARIDGAPRRAAVSSFGYSGTNAHLVIEEYVRAASAAADDAEPSALGQIFVLSARTADQLRQRAADLLAAIDDERLDARAAAAIAYTLQVGREAMRHRLAIKATSLSRLADRLRRVVDGDTRIDDCHFGEARQGKGMLDAFAADEDTHELIVKWLRRGKHHKLLDLWVKGLAIDWRRLHARELSRLALPTYPFARERHWVAKAAASADAPRVPFLHPRVQRNTSVLDEQRFSSDFTGTEAGFVDRGHECHGVTLLDMARVAVELATGWTIDDGGIVLHDIDWNEPATRDDGDLRLHVALSGTSDGPVRYEVFGDDAAEPRRTHVTGSASRSSGRPSPIDVVGPARPDRLLRPWNVATETFEPPALVDTDAFVQLLDAAQSWLGLAGRAELRVDHADRVTIHALPLRTGHAIVEKAAGDDDTTLDIYLCDHEGEVMVAFEGLRLGRDEHARHPDTDATSEPMILQERWERSPIATADAAPSGTVCFVVGETMVEPVARVLRDIAPGIVPVWLVVDGGEGHPHVARRGAMTDYASAMAAIAAAHGTLDALVFGATLHAPATGSDWADVLCTVRNLPAAGGVRCRRLLLCSAYDDALSRAHAESWIGLERSLHVLAPGFATSVVMQEGLAERADAVAEWVHRIVGELKSPFARSVLHAQGERFVSQVREPRLDSRPGVLRNGGVYWVTGGTGGLGGLVARHLMSRYGAKVIVSGRRVLDDAMRRELSGWDTRAGEWLYVTADVTDEAAMRACVARAVERFGPIEGVVHAAGTLDRTSVMDKSPEAFARVLAPKVSGTLALDAALATQSPRFICYFASTSAVLGDFGAGDYAVANRFQMAYADHVGGNGATRRIAIDWPAWADGGMRVGDEQATRLYLRATGQHALDSAAGLDVFERALGQPSGHYLVMVGDRPRIERYLGLTAEAEGSAAIAPVTVSAPPSRVDPAPGGLTVEQRLRRDLRQQVSELLKLPVADVSPSENLADYGFDSILLTRWASRISERYAIALTPAVFFSHPTLGQVGDHLLASYAAAIGAAYENTVSATRATMPGASTPSGSPRRARIVETRDDATISPPVPEPIAIIGMSGRFAQARDIATFWETLVEGRDAVTEIPRDRFDWTAYVGEDAPAGRRMTGRWMGACPGIGEFDAAFFDISPREALGMDPRQRLLMQEAWNALENAAYGDRQREHSRTGVFVGVEQGEYQQIAGSQGTLTSNHDAILASRLSYFLNLRGPAMAINTSCSSGLVAAHQACQSLRAGDCDTAIAAAVNLMLTPHAWWGMSQAGMLSEDGRCRAFDRRANGLVPGEAVVAVVLKRLSRAQADGDPIHAVIVGSGINYDGRTNGITAPNGAAQAELIGEVQARAKVHPHQIGYVVTHGTGTRLGDPVEINALDEVFGATAQATGFCALTSVKGAVGHAFAAAGLVNLVCAVQALTQRTIPPSLYCEERSDYIDWSRSAFEVNRERREWVSATPRVAAVSAFGMSGTNAHMLVREYQAPALADEGGPAYWLLAVSAKSEQALRERLAALARTVRERTWSAASVRSLGYTLLCGRQPFAHRCMVVAQDADDAIGLLERAANGERPDRVFRATVPRDFAGGEALHEQGQALIDRLAGGASSTQGGVDDALYALADLFCQGYALPWAALFGAATPRRIALPGYPFARDVHYVAAAPAEPKSPVRRTLASPAVLARETQASVVEKPAGIVLARLSSERPSVTSPVATRLPVDRPPMPVDAPTPPPAAPAAGSGADPVRMERELTRTLADALYMDVAEVDPHRPFAEMGLDSIIGVEWVRTINQRYGLQIPAARIYDFPDVHQLSRYLVGELNARRAETPAQATASAETNVAPPAPAAPIERAAASPARAARAPRAGGEPIAIVGMSGRYPGAADLEMFWRR